MTQFRALVVVAVWLVLVPSAGSASRGSGVIVFAADRKPTVSGEIYRTRLDGRRVDLSRSAAFDGSPALSTDGRSVAFVSTRDGYVAVYVVGLNGRNAKRVSPRLGTGADNPQPMARISWSPDSRQFAALISGASSSLYLARPGHGWRTVRGTRDALNNGAVWSPDGRLLAFTVGRAGEVRVIDTTGKTRWTVPGESATWSARGRLAVQANSYTLAIYDETGHELGSFAARASAWSPNGDRLASLTPSRKMLEIRTGGLGRPTLRHPLSGEWLGWLGADKLRIFGANGFIGFDVQRARTFQLPGAYLPFGSVSYVDGTRAVAELFGRERNALEVTDHAGRSHVVATALPCPEANAFSDIQFIAGGRSVIYATACPAPPSDIYSVAPDGSGLRQLTRSVRDDTQPAVSSDGRTIAYDEVDNAVKCGGCPNTIWLMNADGTSAHALPNAPDAAYTPYDDYPTFSPDGSQLLFVRGGPNGQSLFVTPAGGGAVRDLGIAASYPAWGPQRIAFQDGSRVVTAQPDGKDQRPATLNGRAVRGISAWSPDGRLAVLASDVQSVEITITGVGAQGKRLSFPDLRVPFPSGAVAWSPDGARLAFTARDREGVGDVWMVGVDGHGLHRVTHGLGALSSVAWR